jgi:hypothetical protein
MVVTGNNSNPARQLQFAEAEHVAIAGLQFIASDSTLLSRFLSLTGIEACAIRQAAESPAFLGEVLAFIIAHEPTLLQFSRKSEIEPATAARAHEVLCDDLRSSWDSA